MTGARPARALALALLLALPGLGAAQDALPAHAAGDGPAAKPVAAATQNGRDVFARFRSGLGDATCESGASQRWQAHFAHAPLQLAAGGDDVLPLFAYVVDALREASLPTEYALIPFIESGYKPGARSPGGPAGLWQMIGITARSHGVVMRPGYDGRLSPVESTQAAVRYLKTLHGMFAGDWRLAVMAYNAGEYRVLGALKRSGQRANAARPQELSGLADITQAYVRKLHALSCLLDQASERDDWMRALDRPIPRLAAVPLDGATGTVAGWATGRGVDAGLVRRINPAFAAGRIAAADGSRRILAPVASVVPGTMVATVPDPANGSADGRAPMAVGTAEAEAAPGIVRTLADAVDAGAVMPPASHTVAAGDSAWTIARRHGVTAARLLQRNGLNVRSVLRPGTVLALPGPPAP